MSSAGTTATSGAQERRQAKRRRVIRGARLIFGFAGSAIDCRVIDESEFGMLVETAVVTDVPHLLAIRFDSGALFNVVKRWTIGTKIGLEIAGPQIIDLATYVRMQSVLDVMLAQGVESALTILRTEKYFEIARLRRAADDTQIAIAKLKALLGGTERVDRIET